MGGTVEDLMPPADLPSHGASSAVASAGRAAVTQTDERPADVGPASDGPAPAWAGPLHGPWRVTAIAVVTGTILAGLVLRFWTHSALWLDEALTVDIARLPLRAIPSHLRQTGAPPLFYILLHFWMGAFGRGDVAVRSLSGVLSAASLPVAWVAARRFANRTVAWILVALLASAPFAVYYATEARMYALVMFLTACGVVAVERALRRPRPGNLVAVAVLTGALLYSQYWSLYLVAGFGIWVLFQAWRGRPAWRVPARWLVGAVVVGCLLFVPWVPTFLFQAAHTGTPWAKPANFGAIVEAVTGFTDNQATLSTAGTSEGRLLALLYFVLAGLALFGVARDRWHVDLDVRSQGRARGPAFVVAFTLTAAVAGGLLSGSAFTPRYAAVVFVPLLLLVAYGCLTLADVRLRAVVVGVMLAAGLAVSAQNVGTQRTQAPPVARALAAHAKTGDVVAFCPDQLGPAVDRLVPSGRYTMLTYPRGTSPAYVDWVNYDRVARASDPAAFARRLEDLAGTDHDIWLVWAPGYQGFGTKCQTLASDLATTSGYGAHQWVTTDPQKYYEPMTLLQVAPLAASAAATTSGS